MVRYKETEKGRGLFSTINLSEQIIHSPIICYKNKKMENIINTENITKTYMLDK
ncbi:MAG: hypothetical protein FWD87_08920 [Spirochaetaceae bacterium]|nr:hypothetical protein [Spirochaetaceae bacterium]